MARLPKRWPVPVAVFAIVMLAGAPALAQSSDFPNFTFGARGGSFYLNDSDTEDTYGLLPLIGADAKLHLGRIHLAIQTSFDWSFGTGDVDDIPGVTVVDSDSDITLYAWRVTALLEPIPGTWGSETGGFYVTPYLGVGVGLHIVDQDVDADTTLGQLSESASESVVGYHAVGGIDFVFRKTFSIGAEILYTTARIEDALDEKIDIGGFGGTVTLRIHL